MKKAGIRKIAACILLALALALAALAVYGWAARRQSGLQGAMVDMRNDAVLKTAAAMVVDQEVLAARKLARAEAKEKKLSRGDTNRYIHEKEAEARAKAEARFAHVDTMDTKALMASVAQYETALSAWSGQVGREKAAYAEAWLKKQKEEAAKAVENAQTEGAQSAEGEGAGEAGMAAAEVDYSDFKQSEQAAKLEEEAKPYFDAVYAALMRAIPDLTPEGQEDMRLRVQPVLAGGDATFAAAFDRFDAVGALSGLKPDAQRLLRVARHAKELLLYSGMALVFSLIFFCFPMLKTKLGMPRLIISAFFVVLLIMAGIYNISMMGMLGTILWRTGMYGVLALAMLPGIQSGISLNMGMTVGIIAGLLSSLLALEWNMTGLSAFLFAVLGGMALAAPVGILYGKLLNRLKGSEMTISTYVGFSYVSLFCMAWMLLPFRNAKLTWALGRGLRSMHNMGSSFGQILDNFLAFEVMGTKIPTGLLLFFLLCCFALYLFSRSKTGTAMLAAGANPRFAEAAGISVNRMRIVGTTLSTMVAAVGIIVYSQSFGFMQLYNGPKQMGFIAASAILIGGATVKKAKVSHVIIGTFLFQGVLALGIQVANAVIAEGGLSEIMRILISNGIILYALTQSGGADRG